MSVKSLLILIIVPILVFVFAITLNDKTLQPNPYGESPKEMEITNKESTMPPETMVDITKDFKAIIKTTEGDITVKLNALDTTITTTNFVHLARLKFYDGLIFHRIIKDFMIQTGDPRGNGTGGPGYTFNDEPFDAEYTRGTVAMANSGENTNGSQFFIMHKDNLDMPKNYIVFGKVIEGIEVIDKIADTPVEDNGTGEISKPINPVSIVSVEIIEE